VRLWYLSHCLTSAHRPDSRGFGSVGGRLAVACRREQPPDRDNSPLRRRTNRERSRHARKGSAWLEMTAAGPGPSTDPARKRQLERIAAGP